MLFRSKTLKTDTAASPARFGFAAALLAFSPGVTYAWQALPIPQVAQSTTTDTLPTTTVPATPKPPITVPPVRPTVPRLPVTPPAANLPPARCSERDGRVELKNGEIKTLLDMCVLNYRSTTGPSVSMMVNLNDGSRVDLPLDIIKEIRLDGLIQSPMNPPLSNVYANVHIVLMKSEKELDGQTTASLGLSQKGEINPERKRETEDPFVVTGKDPEFDGARVMFRFSQVKSIAFKESKK